MVCRMHYRVLRPVIECGLSSLVVSNDADWPTFIGTISSMQKVAEAGKLFGMT